MLQVRKHFRFLFCASGVLVMALMRISSATEAVSVPKGCAEVAIYGKNWMMEGKPIDVKQLGNFIDCIKELYKIDKTTDWRKIQSMIPQEVRYVIRKVPHLGKKAVAVAKREGLCFVSVYLLLLYRAVDLYDRAMSLDMDYKMYRQEFEWLQMELQPVIDLIHNELLPQWEYHSTAALRKITTEVIDKLSRYNAELKQLVRVIHDDIKKGLSNRRQAVVYTLGSAAFAGVSMLVGNIPGVISASFAGFMGLVGYGALTATIQKLGSLQNDVAIMCIETEEYRSLLEQKLLHVTLLESLHFFILLSVIILYLWFQPNDDWFGQKRGEYEQEGVDYRRDGQIRGEHDLHGQERDEYRGDGEIRNKNDLDGQERDDNKQDRKIRYEYDLDGQEERDESKQDGKIRDEYDLDGQEKQDENKQGGKIRDEYDLDGQEERDENKQDGKIRDEYDLDGQEERDENKQDGKKQDYALDRREQGECKQDGHKRDMYDLDGQQERGENKQDGKIRDEYDLDGRERLRPRSSTC